MPKGRLAVKKIGDGENSSKFELFVTKEILHKARRERRIGSDSIRLQNARHLCAFALRNRAVENAEAQRCGGRIGMEERFLFHHFDNIMAYL